jgi:hypothetical protein
VSAEDARRKALLERLAACDTPMLGRLAALAGLTGTAGGEPSAYLKFLRPVADSDKKADMREVAEKDLPAQARQIAQSDVMGLKNAERSYGTSWKMRGGVDTFHMLQRKWQRLENRVSTRVAATKQTPGASAYDVFEHVAADPGAHGLIDDIRDLRRYLMLVEAEIRAREALAPDFFAEADAEARKNSRDFLDFLGPIAAFDVATIEVKERAYGDSWKRNGGIGAFMIFARKWDRIKMRVSTELEPQDGLPGAGRDNILEHIAADHRSEPVLDDVRDLRQFLLLVEAEMAARGVVQVGTARDDRES